MQQPITSAMRRASLFMRGITAVVLVTFTSLIVSPAVAAVRTDAEKRAAEEARAPSAEQQLNERVQQVEARLAEIKAGLAAGKKVVAEKDELKKLRREIEQLDKAVTRNFEAVETQLRARQVPEAILQRHREAVQTYRAEFEALTAGLRRVESAKDDNERRREVDKAAKRLEGKKYKRAHQPFDPEQMPHHSPRPDPDNKPRTKKKDYTQAGLFDHPLQKYAALGDFKYDSLAGASDPAYLAETVEVTLTEAVKAKALELGHDPVKIYHWVRNTIEWIPSWGAMQDADVTLGSQRGNAFDIASLTIALLRASGVPARYVHGAVEVPADKFRNWAGGFTDITAAATFASSGGIPLVSIIESGRIAKIRMEHIWVEAAIDYYPSRGAVMRDADAWVELDPSYKQYTFMEGLDVAQIAGIDGAALADSFTQSGTVNEQEGWVQNLDATLLQQAQADAQQKLRDHIANNMTDPTVGDVIGGRKTIVQEFPNLPSALPSRLIVKGARYGEVPDKLRSRITFAMGTDILGDLINPKTLPYASINNHRVTLSFRPATTADEDALKSLLPTGEITDINQLPKSIPSYLISVIPELKVEGTVVLAGTAMRLGEDLPLAFQLINPSSQSRIYQSPVVAGSYLAFAGIGGSVSSQKLTELKAKLEGTKSKLESQDQTQIASLTREDLLGDMFHAGVLGYYAEYLALGHLAGLSQKNHVQLMPSAGTYGYAPEVSYLFGFPRAIIPGGVEMDLDAVATATSTDGKGKTAWKNFNIQMGALSSALEHAIPEQMFVTPENPGEGVSAVKALQKAAQLGQRIYRITQANMATALPNLHFHPETLDEIRQALNSGKEVITHTHPISVPGWSGAGYVITDPETGAGAWKIGGGLNGGGLFNAVGYMLNALNFFYGFLDALAGTLGKAIPILNKVAQMIQLAKFAYDLLDKGMVCKDFGAIAWFMTLMAVFSLLIVEITMSIYNPLAGFVIGTGVDLAVDWLISQTPDCH